MGGISACHYMLRQYLPAIDKAKMSVERQPQYPSSYRWLAIALARDRKKDTQYEREFMLPIMILVDFLLLFVGGMLLYFGLFAA